MGQIRVGTAGWTDRTLIAAGWYPAEASTPERRLRYYASQFPLVEVDATYYALPAERTARAWAERTPAGFTFNVKAFSLFTQHPTPVRALPADLREAAGRAGKDRVCVEFRNRTWMTEDNQRATLDFLAGHGLPYVCVDEPQGYPSSIPPVLAATSDLAVVRMHGHSDKWTSKQIAEKFGYRYGEAELDEWAGRLRGLTRQADATQVLFNNCYRDWAHVNARQLSELLAAPAPGA
ncbi:MAG TPA: DUF72 domain-containing protein [Streptosporangiaceae bacterium]|nr:DUF72 domain-containing protein [Streptosporangiaceae bacterium]